MALQQWRGSKVPLSIGDIKITTWELGFYEICVGIVLFPGDDI
jgi:hypothetical protein